MKRLFPVILILCNVIAWVSVLPGNGSAREAYAEYMSSAADAYENGYYLEALSWAQKAEGLQDINSGYECDVMIRDSYFGLGESEAYLQQCFAMIQKYPDVEENYEKVISFYDQKEDMMSLTKYLETYLSMWPDNETIKLAGQKLDCAWEYIQTGYYDVKYTACDLIDVQKLEFVERDGESVIERTLINSSGNTIFDMGYAQMEVSRDGSSCFVCAQDGTWRRVDVSNHLLAQNRNRKFESVGSLAENGIAKAVIDGTCHFVNEKMQVSELAWEDAGTFSDGINAVKNSGTWAVVSGNSWENVQEYPYTDIPRNSQDICTVAGIAVVGDSSGYYIIETENFMPVSDNVFEELKAFESNQPTAYRSGEKWGFVNNKGNIYIEASYEDANPFINGYAAVKVNGLWGYIDRNEVMVVEPQFEEALNVLPDGIAYVKNDMGYWDYIIIDKLYYSSQED